MSHHIAIVTQADDLHAYAVRHELRSRGIDCQIIETDRLSGVASPGLSWGTHGAVPVLPTTDESALDPRELDLVWWRRVRMYTGGSLTDAAHIDLVANDCQASLLGTLLASFTGRWIDYPFDARAAENKVLQLAVARDVGFHIPRTLVSQDPQRVREFLHDLNRSAIVKSVQGTPKAPLITTVVISNELDDADVTLCPAIYQEMIPGARHIRANVFGDRVEAALIESDHLDWRPRSDNPISRITLDGDTIGRLQAVLRRLNLRMGIFDLKISDTGELYWLEVNPQGQWLFVQAQAGMDLVSSFCDFLTDELVCRAKEIVKCP